MTGKQLKYFAAQVHDEAIIEVKEGDSIYGSWNQCFQMQASYVFKSNPVVSSDHEGKTSA
jgi:hypothetical protein